MLEAAVVAVVFFEDAAELGFVMDVLFEHAFGCEQQGLDDRVADEVEAGPEVGKVAVVRYDYALRVGGGNLVMGVGTAFGHRLHILKFLDLHCCYPEERFNQLLHNSKIHDLESCHKRQILHHFARELVYRRP